MGDGAYFVAADVTSADEIAAAIDYAALAAHIIDNPMLNGEINRLDGAIRMASR